MIIFISGIAVLVSMFQTFVYIAETPQGFVYRLLHNYEQDYYWYLSLIQSGRDGVFFLTSRFTPEVFPGVLVNTFFPLLGVLGFVTHIPNDVLYTLARFAGGVLLLVAGYTLARAFGLDRRWSLIAFLLMLFGVPFTWRQSTGEFWTGFDPIMRVSFLPHHLFASVFLIFVLIFALRYETTRNQKWILAAGLSAFFAVWTNPASGFILALSLFVAALRARFLLPVLPAVLLPMAILYILSQGVFPWSEFGRWERFNQYPIDAIVLLGTLGIPGLLAIGGIMQVLQKKSPGLLLVAGWFLAPFVGMLFPRFLPVSNIRFVQSAQYIPAAILAAFVISCLGRKPKLVLAALVIFQAVLVFGRSIDRQLAYVEKNRTNPLVYIPTDRWQAIERLSGEAAASDVIIAPLDVSPLIPAFTAGRSVLGHPTFTISPKKKEEELRLFYESGNNPWQATFVWREEGNRVWFDRLP